MEIFFREVIVLNKKRERIIVVFFLVCNFLCSLSPLTQSQIIIVSQVKDSEPIPTNIIWPMYCYDTRHTGRSPYSTENNRGGLKWTFRTELNGILSSPAIGADGTIYVGGGFGSMYAVYPNGTEKWEYKTGFTIYSSPAIGEDGAVYFGSWDGYFYALNPNGTLRWKYPSSCIYSSPSIATDGTIFVATSTGGGLLALNPNGTLKWRFDCGDTDGSPQSTTISSTSTAVAGSMPSTSTMGRSYGMSV